MCDVTDSMNKYVIAFHSFAVATAEDTAVATAEDTAAFTSAATAAFTSAVAAAFTSAVAAAFTSTLASSASFVKQACRGRLQWTPYDGRPCPSCPSCYP